MTKTIVLYYWCELTKDLETIKAIDFGDDEIYIYRPQAGNKDLPEGYYSKNSDLFSLDPIDAFVKADKIIASKIIDLQNAIEHYKDMGRTLQKVRSAYNYAKDVGFFRPLDTDQEKDEIS